MGFDPLCPLGSAPDRPPLIHSFNAFVFRITDERESIMATSPLVQTPPGSRPSSDSDDPTEPFLPRPSSSGSSAHRNPARVLIRLYISHFLSTWNSRMFEFGAVLFLATIFPGTLLYASVYALVRSLSAVVLSSWLGSVVDRSNRLRAIRHSISTLQCWTGKMELN